MTMVVIGYDRYNVIVKAFTGVKIGPGLVRISLRHMNHRRRMEREEKAKFVASVWGVECIQFLAAIAVLPWSI